MDSLIFRKAEEKDCKLILTFIRELADYEKLLDYVVATEEILHNSIFLEKKAQVVIAELNETPIGFALFFNNFSTFLGRPGLYLEDLYIKPEYRNRGYGKKLFEYLAHLAVENNWGRFEWWCLDWNKPSIEFYKKMGAVPMDEWTVYRIDGDNLKNLASKYKK